MTDDQKRALGLGAIGLVGLYVIRNRAKGRTATAPPQATTGNVAPFTPQAPVTLAAGETVYDPNSQAFLTSPGPFASGVSGLGGSGSEGVTGLDPAAAATIAAAGLQPGPQASAPSAPSYQVNVRYPAPVAKKKVAKKPTKRTPHHATRSKVSKPRHPKAKARG